LGHAFKQGAAGATSPQRGGIYALTTLNTTLEINVNNSTISGNDSNGGVNGGIEQDYGKLNIRQSTVLGGVSVNSSVTTVTASSSILGNVIGFSAAGNFNLVGGDPKLAPLANNGGLTLTRLPVAGSLAVNNGDCLAGVDIDQRGLPRPVGGDCDIGAVERQAVDYGWYAFLPLVLR